MDKNEMNNDTVIRNISYDQSEILHNIMNLYNNGEAFECDITASSLKFYGTNKKAHYNIPYPKILMDVCPLRDDIIKITPFNKLPLEDNSISSIVVDLPFVISPKNSKSKIEKTEGSNLISNRFSSFYPVDELFENIYWWLKECNRVLKEGGIIVWKMQSTISGGISYWAVPFSFMVADKIGLYTIDEFILEAKSRLISAGKIKEQKHARKFTSTFWVFKKDSKLASKNSCFKWLENCEKQNLEGKDWDSIEPKRKKKIVEENKETNLTYYDELKAKLLTRYRKEILGIEPKQEKKRKSYGVVQLACNGNFIKEYESTDEVIENYPTISKSSLSQCVNGKIKSSSGFIWIKKEDYNDEYVKQRVSTILNKKTNLA